MLAAKWRRDGAELLPSSSCNLAAVPPPRARLERDGQRSGPTFLALTGWDVNALSACASPASGRHGAHHLGESMLVFELRCQVALCAGCYACRTMMPRRSGRHLIDRARPLAHEASAHDARPFAQCLITTKLWLVEVATRSLKVFASEDAAERGCRRTTRKAFRSV